MVSYKCLALLVLATFASVQATFVKDPTPIVRCHKTFYTKYSISLDSVLNGVGNLLGSVLQLVGLVVDAVGNLVGGLLGLLGLGGKKSVTLDTFLVKPTNEGDAINFLIRVLICQQAVYNKINPGLGDIYVRVTIGSLILSLSARGKVYTGLSIKLLTGDKSKWLKSCQLDDIQQVWKSHCDKFGGLKNITGVKGAIYLKLDALITKITSGVSVLTTNLLDDVLAIVISLLGLVGNIIEGLLDDVLGVLFEYTSSLFVSLDVKTVQSSAVTYGSQYSTSSYSECFTN